MDSDPFRTQRDVGPAVVSQLNAAGFADAEEIGRGGFGIVYRCTQAALDRVVAVKVLITELDEHRERFLREQRAMGRLTGHPNIVGVLQVGQTTGGYPYLVMQYHRQGSLEARISRLGLLPVEEVLRIGVKIAGALESAHRLDILHRDVKPANILLTDYGQPALSDFGIAHITGGFTTAAGTFTGSPAFTAPEILSGEPPSQASDTYSLGATLFAALTGHAAYERKSGEQMVAQFLRIATEPVPDLRDIGIPEAVSAVIEKAMARDPAARPSAAALGEELQRIQAGHGLPVDDLALRRRHRSGRLQPHGATRTLPGTLPLELTSFIGRRAELHEVQRMLSESRLVTLTGIGGVGKTRLALRAASEAAADFADGVRLVELGDLRDPSLVVDVVAGGLGLRDESGRSLRDVLVEFLCPRKLLLILDNCEQVVGEAAELAETLLQACPDLKILATSRERLGIGGEAVVVLSPLSVPATDREPRRGQPGYDAVALFAERAAAAVPGFALTGDNEKTVARICSRLEGLPLAIELAAARLRAMSPEQILERLGDRYTLLTQGSRAAPARQQALAWSIGWSYDLCSPSEQRLWARLSIFAGSFELEAAEHVCNGELSPQELVELLTALVDKSILIRAESPGGVRFKLLDTLREYGREKIRQAGDYRQLRGRHLGWYRRLVADAADEWFSSRQLRWLARLEPESHNLREAMEFALSESPEIALEMVANLYLYAVARGFLSEMHRWLDRALGATPSEPSVERIRALYAAAMIAGLQGDLAAESAWAAEAGTLAEQTTDPPARAMAATAEGFAALMRGDADDALARFESAVEADDNPTVRVGAMMLVGWALESRGDIGRALIWQEKALAAAESAQEVVFRSYALWSIGVGWWRHGKTERAEELLRECLRLTQQIDDPRTAAACLETLAWIARANSDPRRAAVLMGAAAKLGNWIGVSPAVLPDLAVFHDECEQRARETLGDEEFGAATREGAAMGFDQAVACALRGGS